MTKYLDRLPRIYIPELKTVSYVLPEVLLVDEDRINTQKHKECGLVLIDSSHDIRAIYEFTKHAKKPDKDWLKREKDRLGKHNQEVKDQDYWPVRTSAIIDALERLRIDLETHGIWAELLDWKPEKQADDYQTIRRRPDYQLPKGMDAVIYREWKVNELTDEQLSRKLKKPFTFDQIDVSEAITTPVKYDLNAGYVSGGMRKSFDIPADTEVLTGGRRSNEDQGLTALYWLLRKKDMTQFGNRRNPLLCLDLEPGSKNKEAIGSLWGVRKEPEETKSKRRLFGLFGN